MDPTERRYKICIDLILMSCFFIAIESVTEVEHIHALVTAAVAGHTLNMFFNGQPLVMMKNLGLKKTSLPRFHSYIGELRQRLQLSQSISAAAVFGSFSRGSLRTSSDLDVRLVRNKGFLNGIRSCFFAHRERLRSLRLGVPLDIYALDGTRSLKRMSPDEKPVLLWDPVNLMKEYYGL